MYGKRNNGTMKEVLVSVASQGRENYNAAQLNLIRSSLNTNNGRNWYGDYLIRSVDGYVDEYLGVKITKEWPETKEFGVSWQHKDMPYQFKPYAVWEAYEKGYQRVLWCDSTIRIMKNPEPLWEKCNQRGILAWDNEGHPLKHWISDYAVKKTGLQDLEAKQIMACCIMFDFSNPITETIVRQWIEGSRNNSFHHSTNGSSRKDFRTDRHDQSYLSALLSVHGIEVEPYGELAYPHYTPIKPTFLNWGVG
jgi:hypothetical protein